MSPKIVIDAVTCYRCGGRFDVKGFRPKPGQRIICWTCYRQDSTCPTDHR